MTSHWEGPCCWERWKAEGDRDGGWDDWMASRTQWMWTWANSGRWWGIRKNGALQSMGSRRVRHDLATEPLERKKDYFLALSPPSFPSSLPPGYSAILWSTHQASSTFFHYLLLTFIGFVFSPFNERTWSDTLGFGLEFPSLLTSLFNLELSHELCTRTWKSLTALLLDGSPAPRTQPVPKCIHVLSPQSCSSFSSIL